MLIKESRASIYNSNSYLNTMITQTALVITFDLYYEGKEYQVSSKYETYVGTVDSTLSVTINLKYKNIQYTATCGNKIIKVFIKEDITNIRFDKGTILTINFYDVYENSPYSILQLDKEIYNGIVDSSLTVQKTLELLDTLYTITCGYRTIKKFFKEATETLIFDAATLIVTYDNFYLNKNITITGQNGENYTDVTNDTLTSLFSLQQIGSSYNAVCDYKTITFTLDSDTYTINFNTLLLTINFDDHYLNKTYTISASNGLSYNGTVDDTLIAVQRLEQENTLYTISCGYGYRLLTLVPDLTYNYDLSVLTINFDESFQNKTYTISASNGLSYNGTVDDTLTVTQELEQINITYTISCDGTSYSVSIGNTTTTKTLEFIPIIASYEINPVSGAKYGFSLVDDWWQSDNYNIKSSYAMCQINLVAKNAATLTLSCISYGENNYDFGLISKVDTALSYSSNVDSTRYVFKSFKGLSSPNAQTVTMSIPAGEHTVYMKYRKDSSGNSYSDRFKFKVISFG